MQNLQTGQTVNAMSSDPQFLTNLRANRRQRQSEYVQQRLMRKHEGGQQTGGAIL